MNWLLFFLPLCHSHAHGDDNIVFLKYVDKYGVTSLIEVKFSVYFRI